MRRYLANSAAAGVSAPFGATCACNGQPSIVARHTASAALILAIIILNQLLLSKLDRFWFSEG